MPRARNIKPAFFTNEILAGLSHWIRLLFAGLWTLADREGRLKDNHKRIGAQLFPYESALDFEDGLRQLADSKFIQRYAITGERYIQISGWREHQTPYYKEAPSTIPAPETDETKSGLGLNGDESCSGPRSAQVETGSGRSSNFYLLTANSLPLSENSDGTRTGQENIQTSAALREAGERFIEEYPRKVKTDTARQMWTYLVGKGEITEVNVNEIFEGLTRWLDSEDWAKDGGKWIPDPVTFLTGNIKHTGRLWKDHPPKSAEAKATEQSEYIPEWKRRQ